MSLHNLASAFNRRKKRIARGGKRGTTSGRGQKGQKSRAGRRIRPQERDLIIRLPKRRGFKHKKIKEKPRVFNLVDLSGLTGVIDIEKLKTAGKLPRRFSGQVKILGKGEAIAGMTLKGLLVSASAKHKISSVGGNIQ